MKREIDRFGWKGFGIYVIILEFLGSLGLLVGLFYKPLSLFSSCGLAVLMLFGVLTRIKTEDSFLVSTPAIFFMILNAFIFYLAITQTL